MMKSYGYPTLLVIAATWFFPLSSVLAADACTTYTQADAMALFGQDVSEGRAKTTSLPAGQSCRYIYQKNGGTYGISVSVSTSTEIKEEGFNDSAADLMRRQIKARQSGHAATQFLTLPSLGDEAFWSGTSLWVRKADQLFIIKVDAQLDGSFKNMEESNKAATEKNLALSQQAAQTLLSRSK